MEKTTRESYWGSYDGRKTKIKDLDDTHILNLVGFLTKRVKKYKEDTKRLKEENNPFYKYVKDATKQQNDVLKVIKEEVKLRGLKITKEAREGAIPFKNNNKLMKWDYERNRPYEVPKSVRFVKKVKPSSS